MLHSLTSQQKTRSGEAAPLQPLRVSVCVCLCAARACVCVFVCVRILGQWREASGLDAPDAPDAASSTSIDSPAMITVNIEGIVAWLDSKELLKALKKCEKLSGADEAVTALTIAKVCDACLLTAAVDLTSVPCVVTIRMGFET